MTKKTTQNNVPDPNTMEDLTSVRIVRMSEIIQRISTHTIEAKYNLRSTDLRILNLLENLDSITVSEIARKTHVDKAWISRSLTQLDAKGLITRKADANDSRYTLICLTKKGRSLLKKVLPAAQANEQKMLQGIKEKAFKKELNQLLINLESRLAEFVKE